MDRNASFVQHSESPGPIYPAASSIGRSQALLAKGISFNCTRSSLVLNKLAGQRLQISDNHSCVPEWLIWLGIISASGHRYPAALGQLFNQPERTPLGWQAIHQTPQDRHAGWA